MAAPKRQDFVLVLRTRDQAKQAIKALGDTAFNEARKMGREFKKVDKSLKTLDTTGTRVARRLRGGFSKLVSFLRGNLLSTLGLLLASFLSFQGLRAATTNASEFQVALAEIETILPDTTAGTLDLRDAVLSLATAQGENEKIVARGLYQAISAGVSDAGDALVLLGQAQELAVAGVSSTDQTVDLLTTTLNAYRLEVDQSQRVSDVFFETVRLGKTTITELASSIGPVLPLAAALGVDIEQVNAALAVLTTQGFSTSDAATALRALFKSLLKEAGDLDTVFSRLGETYDLNTVRQRGLVDTLDILARGLRDPSESLEVLGGRIEATNALLGLTGKNFDAFKSTADALNNSLGSTSRAYGKLANTDARRVQIAVNAVRIAFLDLGDAILKALADAVESLGGVEALQRTFRDFGERIRPIIVNLIEVVAELARGFVVTADDVELATLRARAFGLQMDEVFSKIERTARALGLISQESTSAGREFQRFAAGIAGEQGSALDASVQFLGTLGKKAIADLDPFVLQFEDQLARIAEIGRKDVLASIGRGAGATADEQAERLRLVQQIVEASQAEVTLRAGQADREAAVTKERLAQLRALQDQIRALERARALEGPRVPARGPGDVGAANVANLTSGLDAGVPNFQGGIALPDAGAVDIQEGLLELLRQQQAVREAIALASQQAVVDAENELGFRELLANVASQSATSSAERAQIERELVGIYEQRTLAQASELGIEGDRLDALESALARLREAREADIEATRRGIDVSFRSFDASEKALLSQVQGHEAAIELIEREADARQLAVDFQLEQGRITDDQAARLRELIALIEQQRLAAAQGTPSSAGQSFEDQRGSLLSQLGDSAAQIEAIRATAEARRADIALQERQGQLNVEQAGQLRSLVSEIERQNVAQAALTPTMQRNIQAVEGYTNSLAFGLEDALVAVATGAKSTKEAMSDFVRSLIADLIRLAVRLTITNVLLAIFDSFTTLGTGTTLAAKNAASIAAVSNLVVGPGLAGVPVTEQFEDGGILRGGGFGAGIVTSPTLALAGEGKTDEGIVPLKNGAIPVEMSGGGGSQLNVTFQINAVDPRGGTEFILSKKREVVAMINEALAFDQPTKTMVRNVAGTRGGGLS